MKGFILQSYNSLSIIIYYAPSMQTYIKQDAVIKIRLYLATCFGRDRPSSGQLRTTIKVQ